MQFLQWTDGGSVLAEHVGPVGTHGKSPPFGSAGSGSIGLGITGLWLSFTIILFEIFQSNGISILSCGSKHNHSHLFHPVPLKLHDGLDNLVSSAGIKQSLKWCKLLSGYLWPLFKFFLVLHPPMTPWPQGSPEVHTESGQQGT